MKHLIRKCSACNRYTLRRLCPKCNAPTLDPHPPKYSPDDKYVRYRIADRYAQIKTEHNINNNIQEDV
ncbi:MAG TPA: RNA-protein complex protein Nop10 [Nitrososphaeraceae archaeon]|jgi:H/ACA ribonucleoprotein complex subunit 3|nr:RNA-protein complex protein Nop10 [Nitrososphaeraceae archaeon]